MMMFMKRKALAPALAIAVMLSMVAGAQLNLTL
jgi:hypothetical protein